MSNLTVSEHHLCLTADPRRMKVIAEAVREYLDSVGSNDTTLRDFCFNLEVSYQMEMGLEEDDFDFAEEHALEDHYVILEDDEDFIVSELLPRFSERGALEDLLTYLNNGSYVCTMSPGSAKFDPNSGLSGLMIVGGGTVEPPASPSGLYAANGDTKLADTDEPS